MATGPDVFYIAGGPASGGSRHISQYDLAGNLLARNTDGTIDGVGGAVDPVTGNPVWTNWGNPGRLLTVPAAPQSAGVLGPLTTFVANTGTANSESVVFRDDKFWVGHADGSRFISEFDYASKTLIRTITVPTGRRGTDWISLAPDKKTMFYTSEDSGVYRYDISSNTALPSFATTTFTNYAVFVRQSDEVVFVTGAAQVNMYDKTGTLLKTFVPKPTMFGFSAALSLDEKTMFVGDYQSSNVWIIDIATGAGTEAPAFAQPGGMRTGGIFSLGGTQQQKFVPEVLFRKPPSQRDQEYGVLRQGRAIQSMTPGTMQGRVTNASPFSMMGRSAVLRAKTGTSEGGAEITWGYDRFPPVSGTLAGATTSVKLKYIPIPESLHVYLNGAELHVGSDYTLDSGTITLIAGVAQVGDQIDARYAHNAVPQADPLTDPANAKANCGGTAFPWQYADERDLKWSFTSAEFGEVVSSDGIVEYTITIHDNSDAGSGIGGATYWDAWAYFRKSDGCIAIHNFFTGNISVSGYGPYTGTMGPHASVPAGSTFVGVEVGLTSIGRYGRMYREMP